MGASDPEEMEEEGRILDMENKIDKVVNILDSHFVAADVNYNQLAEEIVNGLQRQATQS